MRHHRYRPGHRPGLGRAVAGGPVGPGAAGRQCFGTDRGRGGAPGPRSGAAEGDHAPRPGGRGRRRGGRGVQAFRGGPKTGRGDGRRRGTGTGPAVRGRRADVHVHADRLLVAARRRVQPAHRAARVERPSDGVLLRRRRRRTDRVRRHAVVRFGRRLRAGQRPRVQRLLSGRPGLGRRLSAGPGQTVRRLLADGLAGVRQPRDAGTAPRTRSECQRAKAG